MRAKRKRNSLILELHKRGISRAAIAAKHGITNSRINQIVAATSTIDERRDELQAQYGMRPNIPQLSDDTPLDVLMLISSQKHGWAARILALSSGSKPIRTLGELRSMSDRELLARRGVGAGLFAAIRAVCPYGRLSENDRPTPRKLHSKPSDHPMDEGLHVPDDRLTA